MPSGHEVHHYLERNDDHEGSQVVDIQAIGLADDHGVARHAGDPLILGFVDFVDPACASTTLSACKLQFSKFPGPRFGGSGSTRGKR
ncbi:hypothetical protein H5410_055970 [Solanum commersonii]|uniref:Uncharacterized protein n=1 Tax=Solanum commersonii TaxID=4109 RepID=A0A9J5WKX0_SOLCO|nr:hypothetical protein H5410_055970 [Solanum commersonii]